MKRQFLWVIILPLLILSCVVTPSAWLIYDESVPLEESAWISTRMGTITGYNGITVKWKQVWGNKMVQIPAGDTLLEVDLDTEFKGTGLIFQYNFQAGKLYYLSVGWGKETNDIGIHVYTYDIGEKISASPSDYFAHEEAFTPFLNAEGNAGVGGQTILE
jgi:hypothetical protein